MSKLGRKPIDTTSVDVQIKDNVVQFKGSKSSGSHEIPDVLKAEVADNKLTLKCDQMTRENKMLWGLNRALLANKIQGARKGFEQEIIITGLGFKGVASGGKVVFSLGYTHKIDFPIPTGIVIDIDKTGQKLMIKGSDKELVGFVSSQIRAMRPPEPYKATGIKLAQEEIIRKVGKKSA